MASDFDEGYSEFTLLGNDFRIYGFLPSDESIKEAYPDIEEEEMYSRKIKHSIMHIQSLRTGRIVPYVTLSTLPQQGPSMALAAKRLEHLLSNDTQPEKSLVDITIKGFTSSSSPLPGTYSQDLNAPKLIELHAPISDKDRAEMKERRDKEKERQEIIEKLKVLDGANYIPNSASAIAINTIHDALTGQQTSLDSELVYKHVMSTLKTRFPEFDRTISTEVRDLLDTLELHYINSGELTYSSDLFDLSTPGNIDKTRYSDISIGRYHPAHKSAAQMLADYHKDLQAEEILSTQIFQGDLCKRKPGVSIYSHRVTYSGVTKKIDDIFNTSTHPKGLLRTYELFNHPDALEDLLPWKYQTTHGQNTFKKMAEGISPRVVLAELFYQRHDGSDIDIKKLSKKQCHNLIDNMVKHTRMRAFLEGDTITEDTFDQDFYFRSLEGESIVFNVNNKKTINEIRYLDRNGDLITSYVLSKATNINRSFLNIQLNSFVDLLFVHHLPERSIETPLQLYHSIKYSKENGSLNHAIHNGASRMHNDIRDEQGRKVKAKDIYSWIEKTDGEGSQNDIAKHFQNSVYLHDTNSIENDAILSSLYHILEKSGFELICETTVDDLLEDTNDDTYMSVDGHHVDAVLDATKEFTSRRSVHCYNYKNHVMEATDTIHNRSAQLKKKHAPKADIQWPEATKTQCIGEVYGESIYIRNLATYNSIQEEGSEMNHCAGTYAAKCMSNEYFLWSVFKRDEEGNDIRISTLGMERTDDHEVAETVVLLDQHFGHNNTQPPEDINKLVKKFAAGVTRTSAHIIDYPPSPEDIHEEDYDDESEYLDDLNEAKEFLENAEDLHLDDDDALRVDFVPGKPLQYEIDAITQEEVSNIAVGYEWRSPDFLKDTISLLKTRIPAEALRHDFTHSVKKLTDDIVASINGDELNEESKKFMENYKGSSNEKLIAHYRDCEERAVALIDQHFSELSVNKSHDRSIS